VREEVVLGDGERRPGVDVVDDDARAELDPPREGGIVTAGMDDDLRPAARERAGQRRHVDVLPAGVDPAQHGERTSVLRDERHAHR
jgi:hypothetical protein